MALALARTRRRPARARLHPLLAGACTCFSAGGAACMACARWTRHYRDVTERRATWAKAR